MSQMWEERIAKMTAEVEQLEQAVASTQAQLERASYTARSADRAVQVTVGGRGELTAVEFLDGKYRTMAAAQLSAAVLEATTAARAAMARTVMETVDPLTRLAPAHNPRQMRGIDWGGVFGSLITEESSQGSARPDRFRDEIHEDDEEPPTVPGQSTATARPRKDGAR